MRLIICSILALLVVGAYSQGAASPLSADQCSEENKRWLNTDFTSAIWQSIASGTFFENLRPQFDEQPCLVHVRSQDGRGPLFWAYEFGRGDYVDYLKSRLADEDALDINGKKPKHLSKIQDNNEDFGVGFRPAQEGIQVTTEQDKKRQREQEEESRRAKEESFKKQQQREEEEEFLRLAEEALSSNQHATTDDRDEL
ncbi:acyl-CoA-binding domain-containing protein [Acrasis kona]|uniref:Acyl-CoA-binding domain-containing protein n=1 Tax=Acrasis kona TaxID=1008807 RepID=A0AAW2YZR9_9EUKA